MPSSRGSSWPRNQTQVSCILGRFFAIWAIGSPLSSERVIKIVQWGDGKSLSSKKAPNVDFFWEGSEWCPPWQAEGSFSEAGQTLFFLNLSSRKDFCPEASPWPPQPMLSDPPTPETRFPTLFLPPICPSRLGLKVPEPPVSTPNPCYPRTGFLLPGSLLPIRLSCLSYCLPPQDNHPQDEDHVCLAQCITSQVCPFLWK